MTLRAALVAALALGGCANIASQEGTAVYIHSDPEHVTCEMRGQQGFAMEFETPEWIDLPPLAAPIVVACRAEGYKTVVETLDTRMDGWIFGNAFLGPIGIVAAMVDAKSGAGMRYPAQLDIMIDRDWGYWRRKREEERAKAKEEG